MYLLQRETGQRLAGSRSLPRCLTSITARCTRPCQAVLHEGHHLLEDLVRNWLGAPDHPAHADEVADAHQAVGQYFGIEESDLSPLHRFKECGPVPIGKD